MGKDLAGEVGPWVNAAPGQHHKGHAVLQQVVEAAFGIKVVQFVQHTAASDRTQVSVVIAKIVLYNNFRRFQQASGEVRLVGKLTIAVLQRFNYRTLILRLHLPDGDNTSRAAVSVGHIKNVPQTVAPVSIHQQRDPRSTPVYPPAILVPEVDLGTGGSIRILGEDQELVTEIVLEVMGGGGQERHITPAVGSDLAGRIRRKLGNKF